MTRQTSILRRVIARAGRTLRDAWLMVGITILMVIVLESAFRLLRVVKHSVDRFSSASVVPSSPFEATAWAADYWLGHQAEEAVRWAPYVYLRNPTFQTPHHAVDSLGHRTTPQPASTGGRVVRVFFMGGSTTFGWYQRAAHTIPAEAARRIQTLLGDSGRVEVTNFGVPGHTFTQEILELILQLRAGARPDVVVFYDGINDVMATAQNGEAGLPQNESNRREDFARGRLLASAPGLGNDLRSAGRVLIDAMSRLEFVEHLLSYRSAPPRQPIPVDSLAQDIVRMYVENTRIVEALAASHGFRPVYVWQPALLSTRKPLTEREKWLRRPEADRYVGLIGDLHRAVPPLIGPAMTPIVGDRFIDGTDLFRVDPLDAFVDLFGHTYERVTPDIVGVLMPNLSAAVLPVAQRPHAGPRK